MEGVYFFAKGVDKTTDFVYNDKVANKGIGSRGLNTDYKMKGFSPLRASVQDKISLIYSKYFAERPDARENHRYARGGLFSLFAIKITNGGTVHVMQNTWRNIEERIGYNFHDKELLRQAFIRRSYSGEHGGKDNEILEFIGDKALDLAIIHILTERFDYDAKSKISFRSPARYPMSAEGIFTRVKADLVQKQALADAMDVLGFQNCLLMGQGDILQDVKEQASVKEDLFEAIVGAVTLDCDWNLNVVTAVTEKMIDFDAYFESKESKHENYVGLLQEWAQGNGYPLPEYEYCPQGGTLDSGVSPDSAAFTCCVRVGGIPHSFKGKGASQKKARMTAAKNMYDYLDSNGYIRASIPDVNDTANKDPLLLLNEWIQKNIIPRPECRYRQTYDNDGNAVWRCEMSVDGCENVFVGEDTSKKNAQRSCAYVLLRFLDDLRNE